MKERVGLKDDGVGLRKTIDAYFRPLKAKQNSLPFDCIVFRCGTIVRLDCTNHEPIDSFIDDPELESFLRDDFPDHRFVDMDYSTWRMENQADFEWSQKTAYPAECRKAYGCLMCSSYPLPGGLGGDRITVPWDVHNGTFTFTTIFQHLGVCCATPYLVLEPPPSMEQKYPLNDAEDPQARHEAMAHDPVFLRSVDHESAEHRRLDYMFPKPYAYVDKEMNVFIL